MKAIKAMMQALKAGPYDSQVMLSLGVSHTNELDQQHALRHLDRWMLSHDTYCGLAAHTKPPGTLYSPPQQKSKHLSLPRYTKL
eukprot:scaffold197964_cov21-Prasinocladus_malaysianus.AAC.1